MNLDSFIKKYNGKGVDFDGNKKYWCVDLYRQYCKEVLQIPQSPLVVGAADIWDSYLKTRFNRVSNTPKGIPDKGNIMIWSKKSGGGYGHVAIFIEGDINSFKSFDQNWPIGSLCAITKHHYKNVLGWLRPKGSTVVDYYRGIDLTNKESIKACVDAWKDVVDGKYVKKEDLIAFEEKIKKNDTAWGERVKNEKKQYDELVKKLASDDYLHCTQQVPDILEQVTRLIQAEDRIGTELEPEIKALKERITGIASILGVDEKKIEKVLKKIMANKGVVVTEGHSKICQWLADKGF